MAKRARPSQGAGRGGTRKPVTIDLEANKAAKDTGKPAPDKAAGAPDPAVSPAEPVAMDQAKTSGGKDAAAGNAGKSADARPEAASSATSEKTATSTSAAGGAARDATRSSAAGGGRDGGADRSATPPPPARRGGIGPLLGGIIGALIALFAAAALQWFGALPSVGQGAEPFDAAPIEQNIAELEARIAELGDQQAGAGEAGLSAEARAEIDAAVEAARQQGAEAMDAIESVSTELQSLQSAVSSGEAGDGAAAQALSERLEALEGEIADALGGDESIAALQDRLAAIEAGLGDDGGQALGDVPAALEGIRSDLGALGERVEAVAGEIAPLGQSFDALQARLDEELAALRDRVASAEETIAEGGADTASVARAVAAAGLKSAIDRGSAFATELEAYASVAGEDETVAALRDYAASGVPTVPQLADSFGPVANRIVATGQGLDENASIADRLMASARGLVQVRPVGEVEGDTPGAIAARMEARLKEGDLNATLAEWEALPEAARAASEDFIDQVRARRTVDQLVAEALSSAMAAAGPEEAGQ